MSRSKRKWQKMLKTKIVPKNPYMRVLEVKGKWFKRDLLVFFNISINIKSEKANKHALID